MTEPGGQRCEGYFPGLYPGRIACEKCFTALLGGAGDRLRSVSFRYFRPAVAGAVGSDRLARSSSQHSMRVVMFAFRST